MANDPAKHTKKAKKPTIPVSSESWAVHDVAGMSPESISEIATVKPVTIYRLIDPVSREVRYIGKTVNPKGRLTAHISSTGRGNMTPCKAWIKSLLEQGMLPIMETIEACSIEDWESREMHHIQQYRALLGDRLTNIAEGGNMPYCSKEVRAENGRSNAYTRMKGLWYLTRCMASSIKRAEAEGEIEKADYFRYVMSRIKLVTGDKRIKMNEYGLRLLGHG